MNHPRVFVNMASSTDGKITTRTRGACSLGSDDDRALTERLRERADAMVIGPGTIRIDSRIKQVRDQDPRGEFIRSHCPELAQVPEAYIAEPHTMPSDVQRAVGCIIGKRYPAPIVKHKSAYREARARISRVRSTAVAREVAEKALDKHGSRRKPQRPRRKRA